MFEYVLQSAQAGTTCGSLQAWLSVGSMSVSQGGQEIRYVLFLGLSEGLPVFEAAGGREGTGRSG